MESDCGSDEGFGLNLVFFFSTDPFFFRCSELEDVYEVHSIISALG